MRKRVCDEHAAKGWGGPGGPAPAAGTVGCSSVPFRSRPFQCARIGFAGKQAVLSPGSSTNRRAIAFRVDCGTDRQSPWTSLTYSFSATSYNCATHETDLGTRITTNGQSNPLVCRNVIARRCMHFRYAFVYTCMGTLVNWSISLHNHHGLVAGAAVGISH